ncbi:MAG: transporter substrate-binding domain-containing protein [Synechococcales cyanobacterium RU_4_20]|nr:transporter substrate-binding domain-containing protein [Synechococcales cyanobacterium RU_4_20]
MVLFWSPAAFGVAVTPNAIAPEVLPARTLTVGIKEFQPFVFLPEGNQPAYGYSIDLWNAIAEQQNLETRFVPYPSVPALLQAVRSGQVDAAIAGLSITSDRLKTNLGFSYPFYQSGLQLMVKRQQAGGLARAFGILGNILGNWDSLRALLLVLGSSALVGAMVWAIEHPHNEHFRPSPCEAWGRAFGLPLVTLGTFGYGDVVPTRFFSRCITAVWMGISFFIVANFIASMTVQEMESNVRGLEDLRGQAIGVVAETTAASFLRSQPVTIQAYASFDAAVAALAQGEVQGIVRDYPEVQYFVARHPEFEAVGDRLTHEDYGIALAANNGALRETLDYALVVLQERGVLRSLDAKWFGSTPVEEAK